METYCLHKNWSKISAPQSPNWHRRLQPTKLMSTVSAMSVYSSFLPPGQQAVALNTVNMFNVSTLLNQKDSRWLQLEVCRVYQRQKCSRCDAECKFAHPPPNVEVQHGRTACYDSIKGRCNREKPVCKYFHPPSAPEFRMCSFYICSKISQVSKADGSHLAFTIQTFSSKINFSLYH